MAVLEQEPIPLAPIPEIIAAGIPDGFWVYELSETDDDPDDARTIQAGWAGEAKVTSEVDVYQGVANVDRVARPSHWGADIRPEKAQQEEFRLGLGGILKYITGLRVEAVEFLMLKGIPAEAIMEVEIPAGWLRSLRVDKYDAWLPGESLNLHDAVSGGATISVRYEPELGKLYSLPDIPAA